MSVDDAGDNAEVPPWEEHDLFPTAESLTRAIHAINGEDYGEARDHIELASCSASIRDEDHELLEEAFDLLKEDDDEAKDLLNLVCDGLDGAGLFFKSEWLA